MRNLAMGNVSDATLYHWFGNRRTKVGEDEDKGCVTFFSLIFIVVVLLLSGSAVAAGGSPEILSYPAEGVRTASTRFAGLVTHLVRFNAEAALALDRGATATLRLPGGRAFEVVHDNRMVHPSGNVSWVGYLKDCGDTCRVIITAGKGGVYGRIQTHEDEFLLAGGEQEQDFLDVRGAGAEIVMGCGNDGFDVPPEAAAGDASGPVMAMPHGEAPRTTTSTIDLMVLYTPAFATRHGSGVQARIDQLIAIANQGYVDSGVAISLRLVHTQQVSAGDSGTTQEVLERLRAGSEPAFAGVGGLRNLVGADLVTLLRPKNTSADPTYCGYGASGWSDGQQNSGNQAYSVVGEGADLNGTKKVCSGLVLLHELGHNMGLKHDRITQAAQGFSVGAYPYAYGYGVMDNFATVMAYTSSFGKAKSIGRFSDPNTQCNGVPCGVPEGQATAANNVLALNNVREVIAGLRPAADRKCEAMTSPQLTIYLPYIAYQGGYYWMDLDYIPQSDGKIWFKIDRYGPVLDPGAYKACQPATVSEQLDMNVPSVPYGGSAYWANLGFYPGSSGTSYWYKLLNYGLVGN